MSASQPNPQEPQATQKRVQFEGIPRLSHSQPSLSSSSWQSVRAPVATPSASQSAAPQQASQPSGSQQKPQTSALKSSEQFGGSQEKPKRKWNKTNAQFEAEKLARYDSIGVKPPPKQDNRRRFKVFIDRINRREWAYFHDGIQPTLMYNRTEMTLYDFTQLLKYEFGPKSNAHIEMCTVVGGKDDDEGPVAARMRVKTTVLTNSGLLMSSAQRKKFEYARHMVVYFSDKKICEISDLSDEDAKSRQPSRVLGLPGLRPPPPPLPIDMQQFYADYIACINATKGGEEVQKFCKQAGVVHNGARLALDRYCRLMSSAFDAIEDLQFVAHTVLHDEVRQLLAVRIDFTGTPVRPFGGGIPNGKTVVFSELVFYWLENGKISDVLSIVDWAGYRTQLIY